MTGFVHGHCSGEHYPEVHVAYLELIFAVASRFPGETRHQTALRYIRERERDAATGSPECKEPA